jgi:hypothetical protein
VAMLLASGGAGGLGRSVGDGDGSGWTSSGAATVEAMGRGCSSTTTMEAGSCGGCASVETPGGGAGASGSGAPMETEGGGIGPSGGARRSRAAVGAS